MPSRLQNKVKQLLYRPAKPNPALDATQDKLSEIEKALNASIGGVFKKKEPKAKKKGEKKEEKK